MIGKKKSLIMKINVWPPICSKTYNIGPPNKPYSSIVKNPFMDRSALHTFNRYFKKDLQFICEEYCKIEKVPLRKVARPILNNTTSNFAQMLYYYCLFLIH